MPTNITNGQTLLLMSDFIAMAKSTSHDMAKQIIVSGIPTDVVDFYTPAKIVFPKYVDAYTKTYFDVASNTSSPIAFNAAVQSCSFGKIYEESVPSDCLNDGILNLEVTFGAAGEANNTAIVKNVDEGIWDLDDGNVKWRMAGRKFRAFLPTAISSSTPKWTAPYKRYGTVPTSASDPIDAPAEDVDTLFTDWFEALIV